MAFSVVLSKTAQSDLDNMTIVDRALIISWVNKNLKDSYNPRAIGYPLDKYSYNNWKYRIGDYRILSLLERDRVVILSICSK